MIRFGFSLLPLISLDSVSIVPTGSAPATVLNGQPVSAILDTGTSLIAGPNDAIAQIHAQIGARDFVAGWTTLDCASMATMPRLVRILDVETIFNDLFDPFSCLILILRIPEIGP